MKNRKFAALLLVTILLLSCAVTGCGKKITAKECAQIYWDMNVKYDTSNVSKLNLKEDEIKTDLEKVKEDEKKTIKTSFTAQGLTATDEQIAEVYDAMLETLKKATVTIEEVSNDGKKAEIKYKTTYINMTEIATKAKNDSVQAIQNMDAANPQERVDKYSEMFMKNLANEIKSATFSQDTKEKSYTFTMENKVWAPEGKETLGKELGGLISGQ